MLPTTRIIFAIAAIGLLAGPPNASAQRVDEFNYASNTPGRPFFERAVMLHDNGAYDSAAANYLHAARWGDKLAQFNLGVMHVNGEGMARDPVRGWAWIQLSAERGYAKYAAVADEVARLFTPDQRAEAQRLLERDLLPRYGDEVTFRNAENEMWQRRNSVGGGGSRIGVVRKTYVDIRDGASMIDGDQLLAGEQFYHPDLWDMEAIAAFEKRRVDADFSGNVVTHDLILREDDLDR